MITVDFKRLRIKPKYRILDVGCGSGRHIGEAIRYKSVITVGIDINIKDLTEAKNRISFYKDVGEYGGGISGIFCSNSLHLPFQSNSFDIVICSEVLEHIHDDKNAIKEMIRVLKPGGTIVFSVPRYIPEKICWALSKNYSMTVNGHIRIYKKKDIAYLMKSANLKFLSYHFAHSIHTPYWWLKCIVENFNSGFFIVNLYHRFLVWDIMKKPFITRFLDNLLNPLLGKSVVFYLRK